jgi:ribA/ribD-fused uncharacterized protein
MTEDPFENYIAKKSGLPVKDIKEKSNDPFATYMYKKTGDANVFAPTQNTPRTGFSGLDLNAATISLTNTYTDPLEDYTSYGVPRNAFADWNETRAQNQGTVEKWANGLTKAGITALGAVAENTVGVAGGLLNLAFGENHSYYDNPVGRSIDEINKWAQEAMPNYYTQREQDMGVLEGMTTANFWADKFANGAGYTLGSLATAWLGVGEGAMIAKLGNLGRMSKIAKATDKAMDIGADAAKFGSKQLQIYNAAKVASAPYTNNIAKGIDQGLAKMARQAGIKTAAKNTSVALHMSLAEASVEAREAKNGFIEEQTAKWEEANPGQEMPDDVRKGIEESGAAAGNLTFGVNLPLLAGTNAISFAKMFKGIKPVAESQMYDIKKVAGKWVEDIPEKGMAKAFAKSNRIFGAPIKNSLSEGFQEAGQFVTAETSKDYYSDKFADGTGDMVEAFTNGLSKSIGTKEGLESILIGALVGGGTGTISRLGGADSKFAKQKDANTKKALDIMNSEAFGKVLENMEQSDRNIALAKEMTEANNAGNFKDAEIARRKIISSVANQYRKVGALDYAMEMMDDLKQLDETEFKKRWGYEANRTLKEQTGMEQGELIDDVKSKMERSVKRQEQVQDILRAHNPSMGMFGRILDSFESEELKKSKALETSIKTMYANVLLNRLEHVDTHDDLIKQTYQELRDLAPALSAIPEEDFEYIVKTGNVKVDDKGEISITSGVTTTPNAKLYEKLNEIFKAKSVLNPEDGRQFQKKIQELGQLIGDRQSAVQSYQALRDKPEDIALLVEAEVAKRKQDDKYKNKQQAQAAVANSESVEELNNSFPKNADPEDIAAAIVKREELIAKEDAVIAGYRNMSKEDFDAIDPEKLSPIEESAYKRYKKRLDELEAEKNFQKNIGFEAPDAATTAATTASYEEVLSDIEARTFGEIMVSSDGSSFTIDGRTYSNLEVDPVDALIRDELGTIVGVKVTDMATGNVVTWKSVDIADSANPEVTERENAIAEGLAYMTLLQAASIRADQSIPLAEAKEQLEPRIQAIKEDAAVREKFEENNESTETERELAKNNLSKTAGLTDDQLRAQIETLKSDLEEVNQIITIEEQIAKEAGFTKKEFDQDPQTKELRAIKKRITQLLNSKIKTLRERKQAKRQDALGTTETTAEVENVLSPSEEDLIKVGLEEEIKKFEDELVPLDKAAKGYQDIIDGKYGEGQDVAAATVSLKEVNKKIGVIKSKITKRTNKINSINEARELEKLRQDRDAAEGAGISSEGQEPEGKDITPREGTSTQGLDGILTEEQAKQLRQQREEAEKLRKLEEEKKKAQATTQPVVAAQPITVTTAGQLDVRLAKGEKTRMEGKVLVSEEGASIPSNNRSQTVGQVPIIVNPALASSPFIATEGTEVRFEVREDTDWWATQTPTAGEEWMTVPIFMYVKDQAGEEQAVGVLQAFAPGNNPGEQGAMRKDIYDLYKKGLTPVAMSAGKVYDSTNYSNAIVFAEDKQTGLQKRFSFFYPASTLVNTGETPAVVFVGIQNFQTSFKLATAGDSNIPNLVDTVLAADANNATLGQVGIIVIDPNGAPRVVMASTRNMTEAGRTAALAKIEAEVPSLNQFSQIVGTNLLLNDSVDPDLGSQVFTEINGEMEREFSDVETAKSFMLVETLANGTELITFFSPSANSLVRMNAANMKVALAGGTPMFSFVELGTNKEGFKGLLTATKDDSVRKSVGANLANEFKEAIMLKKFQVDKNLLKTKEAYTSPITGQVYDSYFQYLTSENEILEERTEGKGTKAILGVDVEVNSQKSPFFDVGIKTTNLGTREQDVTTERELAAKQVVMPTDTKPIQPVVSAAPTTTSKAVIEKEIQEAVDRIADIENNLLPKVNNRLDNNLQPELSALYEKLRNTKDETRKKEINNEIDKLSKLQLTRNDIIELTRRKESLEGQIESAKKFIEKKKAELAALGQPAASTQPTTTIGPETKINIYAGTGENAELSNFAKRPFKIDGYPFNTVEGYFQARKMDFSTEPFDQNLFAKFQSASGAQAKSMGRSVKGLKVDEWDSKASEIMKEGLLESFKQNPDALAKLLATGNATLTHTQDRGKWGTEFPKLLMEVREELRGANPAPQVPATTVQATLNNLATGKIKDIKSTTTEPDEPLVAVSFGRYQATDENRMVIGQGFEEFAEAGMETTPKGNYFNVYDEAFGETTELHESDPKLIKLMENLLGISKTAVQTTPQVSQPQVSDEEKVVQITGAEDTSGIFDITGIPTTAPKTTITTNTDTGIPSFINKYEVKAGSEEAKAIQAELGQEPSDPENIQDLASEAAKFIEQAKNTENNC